MKRHVDDLLPAYLNGTLGESEQDRVEKHLASCAECAQAMNEWRFIAQATRTAFPIPDMAASGNLDRVWAAIDEPQDARPRARRARPLAERTRKEMNVMNEHALSPTPYVVPGRISPLAWLASGLVLLLAMGAFAWYSMNPGGGHDLEPMPAVQLAANATPTAVSCPQPGDAPALNATGTPETTSAIRLPEGPYEGGFHVQPEALPTEGGKADQETINAISQTVAELTACMNAGNADATWALTTEDYVRRFEETGRDPAMVGARAIVPMVGPSVLETPVPEIRNAILLDDGRVGAEIRPSFDAPAGSFEYYVFARQGGRWLIDEAVHVQDYARIEVTVDDSGFTPNVLTVPARLSELVLTNEGTTAHSVIIPGYGTRLEAGPGETVTVVLKGPQGTYPFSSDIPGDDSEGFTGTITFEGSSQPEATPQATSQEMPSTPIGVPAASVTIHMIAPESYAPDRVAVLAGRDVEVTLVNDGTLEANFTIDALGISVDLGSGESETVTINAPEGAYAFYSTIPGHSAVGMSGILFVQAETGQP